MISPPFTIRPMDSGDLDQAYSLSKSEGWNQTLTDWRFLLGKPDNICIVAEKEEKICGTATALVHDKRLAWIGMVLVDRSLRGQGTGRMLMEKIIHELKGIRSVKLDATPAGEPLYSRLGFKPEYKIHRMTCENINITAEKSTDPGISETMPDSIKALADFDRYIFGVNREYLITSLATSFPEKSLFIWKNQDIEGFIQGREGERFTYLGPLSAKNDNSAIELITESLRLHRNKIIALDVPASQTIFIEWLEKAGFVKQREFTRMFLNENPFRGKPENQYLISGPEFG
jgi:ribosomal protein S18 acetylase RimI-like enzyme